MQHVAGCSPVVDSSVCLVVVHVSCIEDEEHAVVVDNPSP